MHLFSSCFVVLQYGVLRSVITFGLKLSIFCIINRGAISGCFFRIKHVFRAI